MYSVVLFVHYTRSFSSELRPRRISNSFAKNTICERVVWVIRFGNCRLQYYIYITQQSFIFENIFDAARVLCCVAWYPTKTLMSNTRNHRKAPQLFLVVAWNFLCRTASKPVSKWELKYEWFKTSFRKLIDIFCWTATQYDSTLKTENRKSIYLNLYVCSVVSLLSSLPPFLHSTVDKRYIRLIPHICSSQDISIEYQIKWNRMNNNKNNTFWFFPFLFFSISREMTRRGNGLNCDGLWIVNRLHESNTKYLREWWLNYG